MSTTDVFEGFDDLDELELEPEQSGNTNISSELVKPLDETLHPQLWGAFCFDVVLAPGEHDKVCAAYNVSVDTLAHLLDNKAFVDRLKDAQLQVKTLGPTAGFVLAARAQAEKHIVTLGNLADNSSVHPSVRVKAVENLVRYAHLDPQTQRQARDSEQRGSSPGVLVQFNIGGSLLGTNRHTIEVQAQPLEVANDQP